MEEQSPLQEMSSAKACTILRAHFSKLQSISLDLLPIAADFVTARLIPYSVYQQTISRDSTMTSDAKTAALIDAVYRAVEYDPSQLSTLIAILEDRPFVGDIAKDMKKEWETQQSVAKKDQEQTSDTEKQEKKIFVDEAEIEREFHMMNGRYGTLVRKVKKALEKKDLKEVKDQLLYSFQDLKDRIVDVDTFDEVMNIVNEKCSFVHSFILDSLVEELKLSEVKTDIDKYNSERDDCYKRIRAMDFAKTALEYSEEYTPQGNSVQITFVVSWAKHDTLYKFEELLRQVFQGARSHIRLKVVNDGSIIFVCESPEWIIPALTVVVKKSEAMLGRMGVMELTIGGEKIFSLDKDKECTLTSDSTQMELKEEMKFKKMKEKADDTEGIPHLKEVTATTISDTVDAKIEANTGADAEQLLKKKEQLKKQPVVMAANNNLTTTSLESLSFNDVSRTKLDEAQFPAVYTSVKTIASRWKPLSEQLGVRNDEIASIEASDDNEACLRAALKCWLQQPGDNESCPCWRILCIAVASESGGQDRALAKEIAQTRQVGEEVLVEIWRQTVTAGGDVVLISSYSDASKSHTKLDFIQDLLLRSSSSHLRYVVPGTQRSKSYCKEKIRKVMEQCDKSGVVIMYNGEGVEGTGDWIFEDGTISFQEIFDLYLELFKGKLLTLVCDCSYSGHWRDKCVKTLDEMGVAACGHFLKERVILIKVYCSCTPSQTAGFMTYWEEGVTVDKGTGHLAYWKDQKLSNGQQTYGANFTSITCNKTIDESCEKKSTSTWVCLLFGRYVYVLRGKDNEGKEMWYYVLVDPEKVDDFKLQVATESVAVTKYGKILYSGLGKDPPQEITDKIREKYEE